MHDTQTLIAYCGSTGPTRGGSDDECRQSEQGEGWRTSLIFPSLCREVTSSSAIWRECHATLPPLFAPDTDEVLFFLFLTMEIKQFLLLMTNFWYMGREQESSKENISMFSFNPLLCFSIISQILIRVMPSVVLVKHSLQCVPRTMSTVCILKMFIYVDIYAPKWCIGVMSLWLITLQTCIHRVGNYLTERTLLQATSTCQSWPWNPFIFFHCHLASRPALRPGDLQKWQWREVVWMIVIFIISNTSFSASCGGFVLVANVKYDRRSL